MLHVETVESGTLSLLRKLMQIPELEPFSLVGGTALSLRYGHRISIDLDLFYNQAFDHDRIIDALKRNFKDDFVYEGNYVKWGIFCFIENVKVDIVYYPHRLIKEPETIDGIRLYTSEDIIAMKINAVLGRGKKKDFWDIAELLMHYSMQQFIAFHQKKYPDQFLLITIPQALSYFADAEESEDPVSLKGQTWEKVKKTIGHAVNEYLK